MDSFDYCRKDKGLQIWAYVVMSNHVHCILSAVNGNLPDIIRDFKRHTASKILKEIKESTESRKDWMLKRFEFAAKSHKRNSELQFWTHEMSNLQTKHFKTKIANSITPKNLKISEIVMANELVDRSLEEINKNLISIWNVMLESIYACLLYTSPSPRD